MTDEYDAKYEAISKVFFALSHPVRLYLLDHLKDGERSIKELTESLPLSKPAISKHLKILEDEGLISRSRAAKLRPAHLEFDRMREVESWIQPYRKLWEERFDEIDTIIKELKEKKS